MSECKTVRDLLALRADDWSADERRQVEAHLQSCPDCSGLVRIYAEQDRLIRAAPRARLTSAQKSQLLSRVQRERRRHKMYTRLFTVLGTAAAALVLIALGLALYGLFRQQDDATAGAAVATGVPETTVEVQVEEQTGPTDTAPLTSVEPLIAPAVVFPGPAIGATGPVTSVESLVAPASVAFADEIYVNEMTLWTSAGNFIPFALGRIGTDDAVPLASLHVPVDVGLTLNWQVMSPPSADWHVFVHLLNEAQELVLQSDVGVDWPKPKCTETEQGTTCYVTTHHEWAVPTGFEPGLYAIRAGLYDPTTGRRAPVTSPTGETSPVTLGQVVIPESWEFAGQIRSLEAGSPIPFTLGEPDTADPTAPGKLTPGSGGRFLLDWQVMAPPSADWRVFVHLFNEAGEMALQSDVDVEWPEQPCPKGDVGPDCTVTTAHEWVLPADLPSGLYTIVIGLYDPATGERAPVTSPVEVAPPQVVLGHVLVVSAKPAAQPSLVTLRIFSGRRDPAWTLTSAQIAGLRERISALPVTDQAYDEAGRLGYTGFTVLLPGVDGHPAQRLAIWKGVVQLETEGQVDLLADEGRSLERWLLETGVGRVEEHIIEVVRGELDVSSSTAP